MKLLTLRSKILRLLHFAVLLLVCAGAYAQAPSSGGIAGPVRYRVTLRVFPGDDLDALARQLAATYRGRLEPYAEVGFQGFEISLSESAARLLGTDPHVLRIEEIGRIEQSAAEVPLPVMPAESSAAARRPTRIGTDAIGSTLTIGPYAYDGTGNIRSMGTSTSFVYDPFNRLTTGTVAAGLTSSYTYDPFGNILSKNIGTAKITLGADSATNRLTGRMDSGGQPVNVRGDYDDAGNMRTMDGYATFEYDSAGTVTESVVKGPTGDVRRLYLYTADDERIASVTPAQNKWEFTIRGLDQKVLRRLTRQGAQWSWDEDYIYRDGLLLAAEVPGPEKTRHFHLDHLGTPRLITGNGGAEMSRPIYYAFGEPTATSSDDGERLRFTGHERDESGLDYMHARYYGAGVGRFLSVDASRNWAPSVPQRWNRYSYTSNNPLKYVDPNGLDQYVFNQFEVGTQLRNAGGTADALTVIDQSIRDNLNRKGIHYFGQGEFTNADIARVSVPGNDIIVIGHAMSYSNAPGGEMSVTEGIFDGNLPSGLFSSGVAGASKADSFSLLGCNTSSAACSAPVSFQGTPGVTVDGGQLSHRLMILGEQLALELNLGVDIETAANRALDAANTDERIRKDVQTISHVSVRP